MIIPRHKCQWCDLRKPPRLVLLLELRHNFAPHQSTANQYPGLGFKKLRPQASSSDFGALQAVWLIYFQIFSYVKLRVTSVKKTAEYIKMYSYVYATFHA